MCAYTQLIQIDKTDNRSALIVSHRIPEKDGRYEASESQGNEMKSEGERERERVKGMYTFEWPR